MPQIRHYEFPTTKTNAGKAVDIQLWYNDVDLASPYTQVMTQCHLLKMSDIDLPFTVDISGQSADSKMRFSSCQFEFINAKYDADYNYFDWYDIINDDYKYSTFIDLSLDRQLYWRGLVMFDQIKRFDYYLINDKLKYKKIRLKCYDALAYYQFNSKILTDIGYTSEPPSSIKSIFYGIVSGSMQYTGSLTDSIKFDPALRIAEPTQSYNIEDMHVTLSGSQNVLSFIKDFMIGTGTTIYSLDGKINVDFKGWSGSLTEISNNDILSMVNVGDANTIEYVGYKTKLIEQINKMPSPFSEFTLEMYSGSFNNNSNKNFIHTGSELIGNIFTTGSYKIYGTPPTSFDYVDKYRARWDGENFANEGFESGDWISLQYNAGPYSTHGSYIYHSYIINTINMTTDNDTLQYLEVSSTPLNVISLADAFYSSSNSYGRRYKIWQLYNTISTAYYKYYLTSDDELKIALKNLNLYQEFSQTYYVLKNAYKVKSAKINVFEDVLLLNMITVSQSN